MTPEDLIAAFARGMMEGLMSAQQPAKAVSRTRGRSPRRAIPPTTRPAAPTTDIPPVQQSMFVEPGSSDRVPTQAELDAILAQAETALRGEAPPGTRIPGEGDSAWMGG